MWHCIFESVYKFEQPSLGFFKEEEEKKIFNSYRKFMFETIFLDKKNYYYYCLISVFLHPLQFPSDLIM